MTDKAYRECMAEIIGVLKKYDMAGAIHIVSKERAAWNFHFPSWGALKFEGNGIRLCALRKDFPSDEAHRQTVELTAHIIFQLRDISSLTFGVADSIAKMLEQRFDVKHKPFKDFNPEFNH